MSTVMSEEIFERLREEFDRVGLSFAEVARQIGEKSPARIRDIYHGRQRCPIEVLSSLAKIGIEYGYVVTGQREDKTSQWKNNSSPVPLYDLEAAAGHGSVLSQENVTRMCSIDEALLTEHGLNPAKCAMLTVRGDSMEPTLQDGDTILIDRSQTTPDGIFLIQMDDTLRVKRVQRAAGGAYILISDNTRYREELIPPTALDTISLLGKCVLKISSVS